MGGKPRVARLLTGKMKRLVLGTLWMLTIGTCSWREMSRIIGHWTWACLVVRAAFSVLNGCYAFVEVQRDDAPRQIWTICRQELLTLVRLFVFLEVCLETPWALLCFATDSSEEGFGVVERTSGFVQLREHGLYCQRRGWMMAVEESYERLGVEPTSRQVLPGRRSSRGVHPSSLFPVIFSWCSLGSSHIVEGMNGL